MLRTRIRCDTELVLDMIQLAHSTKKTSCCRSVPRGRIMHMFPINIASLLVSASVPFVFMHATRNMLSTHNTLSHSTTPQTYLLELLRTRIRYSDIVRFRFRNRTHEKATDRSFRFFAGRRTEVFALIAGHQRLLHVISGQSTRDIARRRLSAR